MYIAFYDSIFVYWRELAPDTCTVSFTGDPSQGDNSKYMHTVPDIIE